MPNIVQQNLIVPEGLAWWASCLQISAVMGPNRIRRAVVVLVLSLAVFLELGMLLYRGAWPGYVADSYFVIASLVIVPWLSGVVAMVLGRSYAGILGIIAAGVATAHGVGVSLGGSLFGAVFVALAAVVFTLSLLELRADRGVGTSIHDLDATEEGRETGRAA